MALPPLSDSLTGTASMAVPLFLPRPLPTGLPQRKARRYTVPQEQPVPHEDTMPVTPSAFALSGIDRLCAAYAAASFDVERSLNPPLLATCCYHARDEAYFLSKKATLWAAESHEYVYLLALPHLDMGQWQQAHNLALHDGLSRIRPHSEHMSSRISLIIFCPSADAAARAALTGCRTRKSFLLGLHGWMRLRALAVLPPSAPDGCPTIHASAAARRDLLPFVRQALAGPAATPQH